MNFAWNHDFLKVKSGWRHKLWLMKYFSWTCIDTGKSRHWSNSKLPESIYWACLTAQKHFKSENVCFHVLCYPVSNELNKKYYFIVKVHLVSLWNSLRPFVLLSCSHVISFFDTSDESFEGILNIRVGILKVGSN